MTDKREEENFVIQSVGTVPALTSTDAIALYDPRNGEIVHMHHIVTFAGAERQNYEEQQQRAIESAQCLGCNVDELRMLHVPNFQPSGKAYKVDLQRQMLVEVQPH